MKRQTCWVVFAQKETKGFATKVEAQRWEQALRAFYPRKKVQLRVVRS